MNEFPGNTITNMQPGQIDPGLRILLVDDNRVNQFLGKKILTNLGITAVDVAGSGEEAMELLTGDQVYDVLLTDVEMPGMSGYDLCRKIRQMSGRISEMVIIALTANSSDDDRKLAMEAGTDDYISKPYSPQDLQEVLRRHARESRKAVQDGIRSTTFTGLENVYALFQHQVSDILSFLKMFSRQLPELTETIRKGVEFGQPELAYQAAHKLKSPVKMLASPTFCAAYDELSEGLRKPEIDENTRARYREIESELLALEVLINSEIERFSN